MISLIIVMQKTRTSPFI